MGGRVRSRTTTFSPDGARYTDVVLWGVGPCTVRFEGEVPNWVMQRLEPEKRAVVVGQAVINGDVVLLSQPELAEDDGKHGVNLAQYGLKGVEDIAIRAAIQQVFEICWASFPRAELLH